MSPLPPNPWCPPFEIGKPAEQPYHEYVGDAWSNALPKDTSAAIPKIKLITWNIDALAQGAVIRMRYGLKYLSTVISSIEKDTPVVVFLQEMLPSDLEQIQEAEWIQERFYITDMGNKYWGSMWYGTTTLIDRRLKVQKAFRVHMESEMERDGLFVDLAVKVSEGQEVTLRLCNAHLESLIADPPLRPGQVKLAAQYMHEAYASVLAGDCNAIQPFDRTLHSDNELKDAYLELGGEEDKDEGYTWGQMAPAFLRERFGCSRMDKIMYCGNVSIEGFEQIGKDVKVEEKYWAMMKSWGTLPFVTDHYGLMADLIVSQKPKL